MEKILTTADYIVRFVADGSVEVYQKFSNTKKSLKELSDKIGFEYDPKWTTQQFGAAICKKYGDGHSALVQDVFILRSDDNKISAGEVCSKRKKAFMDIFQTYGIEYKALWNESKMEQHLVQSLGGEVNIDDDNAKESTRKSASTPKPKQKKIFILVYFDFCRVGWLNDKKSAEDFLQENYGKSLKEVCEYSDEDALSDLEYNADWDSQSFFSKIRAVKVIEGKLSDQRPYDLIDFDAEKDYSPFVKISLENYLVPRKGLAYKQVTCYISSGAEMIVDESFKFDPRKLKISNAQCCEYDGQKLEYSYCIGDDNGPKVYYYNGKSITHEDRDDFKYEYDTLGYTSYDWLFE